MNEWYALTGELETDVPPLDEMSQARIEKRVRSALPRRRKRRALAAVIAAVLVLSACGYAVATGQFSQWFWNMADRDAPEADENLLASMGTVIGQSQTVDGVTATLCGAIWDGETLMLSLTLGGEDMPTDYWTDVQTEDSWLMSPKARLKETWLEAYPDTDTAELDARLDNYWETMKTFRRPKITYLCDRQTQTYSLQVTMDNVSSLESPELELHLENLKFQSTTLPGPFDFTFTVERRFPEAVYEGSVLLEQENGYTLHITKVSLTPLHAEVSFDVSEPMTEEAFHAGWCTSSISGLRAGGELISNGSRDTVRTTLDDDGTVTGTLKCGPFRQVVDPATVEAIQINDTWLELSEMELAK